MKTYLAQFGRNDGAWHGIEYERSPYFTFQAPEDYEAARLAINYARINEEDKREDWWLCHLVELQRPTKDILSIRNVNLPRNCREAKQITLEKLLGANFKPFYVHDLIRVKKNGK